MPRRMNMHRRLCWASLLLWVLFLMVSMSSFFNIELHQVANGLREYSAEVSSGMFNIRIRSDDTLAVMVLNQRILPRSDDDHISTDMRIESFARIELQAAIYAAVELASITLLALVDSSVEAAKPTPAISMNSNLAMLLKKEFPGMLNGKIQMGVPYLQKIMRSLISCFDHVQLVVGPPGKVHLVLLPL